MSARDDGLRPLGVAARRVLADAEAARLDARLDAAEAMIDDLATANSIALRAVADLARRVALLERRGTADARDDDRR